MKCFAIPMALLAIGLIPGSVVSQSTSTGADESELESLVRASRSTSRDEWRAAATRLGTLATPSAPARERVWSVSRVNSLGMKFAPIPAGSFTMGPDFHRIFDIQAAHEVVISKSFFLSVTEITNEQMTRVLPEYKRDETFSPDPDSPAVNVTWEQASRFCERLSDSEGARYRLPTEAEWEFAGRAGATTLFPIGDSPREFETYGWARGRPGGRAARVALLKPNAWGLYDMHGNAVEWVSDFYTHRYYAEQKALGIVTDPQGPPDGFGHVLRGGGWPARELLACSATARMSFPLLGQVSIKRGEPSVANVTGFRVLREWTP